MSLPTGVRHLLLDRDGVLNHEDPTGWVTDPAALRWIDGSLAAVARLSQVMRVSVVTNQSVVGRGQATQHQVDAVNARLVADVAAAGGLISAVYLCPHAPDAGCACRKPRPGMLLQALAESGIGAEATVFVGDSATDLTAAREAGVTGVLVCTGKGRTTQRTTGVMGLGSLAEVAEQLLGAARAGESE